MAVFRPKARFSPERGGSVVVGTEGQSNVLIFDGPNNLETIIYFDSVAFDDRQLQFFTHRVGHGATVTIPVGAIEREDFGAVTEWLKAHAARPASE